MNRKIPDKILEIVGNQTSYSNNVGMSDSEVLIYPDYVLKIQHNFAGHYNGGKKYFDFTHQMLLEELELDMDYDKFRYYILLDELF